ncbi:Hypothetical_protein [Hexamita inflata]|uniref:Hypothetical_protein n=1 Tax=Hexamita inflata TaxID=28002 RepID=A0AA86PFZ0_9EUKA|nr:Hypothetical protein HINF_LOCUS26149 [Hexamita inflata]
MLEDIDYHIPSNSDNSIYLRQRFKESEEENVIVISIQQYEEDIYQMWTSLLFYEFFLHSQSGPTVPHFCSQQLKLNKTKKQTRCEAGTVLDDEKLEQMEMTGEQFKC